MFSFNSNSPEMPNNSFSQNGQGIPLRWRLYLIVLCAYIVIGLLAIGYLTSNLFTASADPTGVVTEETMLMYVQEETGLTGKPDRDAGRPSSAGSAADSDWIDFDWMQWFALDRV